MLLFEIDDKSDVPIWVQLRQRIAFLINSGRLKPGEQLPTVRGLASELSINYNTVNKAYLSLVSDGYLESTRGRGVFVTDIASKYDDEQMLELKRIIHEFISTCREFGLEFDDVEKAVAREIKILRYETEQGKGSMAGGNILEFREARSNKRNATGA